MSHITPTFNEKAQEAFQRWEALRQWEWVNGAGKNGLTELQRHLETFPDLPFVINKEGIPSLCVVAGLGLTDCFNLLLKAGADPHTQDTSGRNALHYAARGNSDTIIRELVNNRAMNVETPSASGETPLYIAAMENTLASSTVLLELGADPDKKTSFGLSPIMIAGSRGNFLLKVYLEGYREVIAERERQQAFQADLAQLRDGVSQALPVPQRLVLSKRKAFKAEIY